MATDSIRLGRRLDRLPCLLCQWWVSTPLSFNYILIPWSRENERYANQYDSCSDLSIEIQMPSDSLKISTVLNEHHGLDWHTRYKIIKGTCEGLAYLHRQLEPRIYHLDLKPANILLEVNMVPRISDFGLSRCFGEEQARNMSSSTRTLGYMGYMAPEYVNGNIISYKSDIYSFGVLIMSIVTGSVDKAYSSNETIFACRDRRWANYAFTRVHDPLIQMVLFANHLHGNEFSCPKSMAPKSITDMVEWSPSSASRNVYEAGWVPAEHNRGLSQFARAFGIIPVETVDRSSHNSLPVLFEKLTKKVTSSNVSSTQRAGRDIFVVDSGDCMSDAAEMKTLTTTCFTSSNMDNAPTGADLVDLANSSGTSMLPPGASLHQQLALNNLADECNDKPRSNSAPSDTSSDQTARVAKKHKLNDDESQNNSDPNSCVAERDTNEEAKRSGKWYVASGAAQHATGDRGVITNLQELENNDLCVHAADGMPMPVRGIGNVVTDTVVLPDVYYVPGLWTNLVSVGQLAGLDYCVGFGRGSCVVNDPAGTVVGRAHAGGDGLYEVEFLRVPFGMPSTGS
ncbi:G-type lectin S-receptor-like serine/threonine-protein kinase [Dichanthelium oligosanthes]|uniref:non-specific serine/threonine protein kinase n=1 Tax=Dichanthelium oligosanthes TaxID=888268 RepID=A0A1E5WBZ4_9POAL|nr:G-type lectin S-receptor-like serine/threonine-protein kinase [Dichanthelium oligosanthes]